MSYAPVNNCYATGVHTIFLTSRYDTELQRRRMIKIICCRQVFTTGSSEKWVLSVLHTLSMCVRRMGYQAINIFFLLHISGYFNEQNRSPSRANSFRSEKTPIYYIEEFLKKGKHIFH